LELLVKKRLDTVTNWIVLPPLQLANLPPATPPIPAAGLPIAPIVGGNAGIQLVSLAPLVPLTPIPLLIFPPSYPAARALGVLGEYFSCTFVDYDKATE
jgi:hypothetical protein